MELLPHSPFKTLRVAPPPELNFRAVRIESRQCSPEQASPLSGSGSGCGCRRACRRACRSGSGFRLAAEESSCTARRPSIRLPVKESKTEAPSELTIQVDARPGRCSPAAGTLGPRAAANGTLPRDAAAVQQNVFITHNPGPTAPLPAGAQGNLLSRANKFPQTHQGRGRVGDGPHPVNQSPSKALRPDRVSTHLFL